MKGLFYLVFLSIALLAWVECITKCDFKALIPLFLAAAMCYTIRKYWKDIKEK